MKPILKEKGFHLLSEQSVKYVIFIGLILILTAGVLMLNEVLKARRFCKSVNGNYSVKNSNHLCNGQKIVQYNYGWDFERNYQFNISNINFTVSQDK